MRSFALVAALNGISLATTYTSTYAPTKYLSGFTNATIFPSAAGKATCIQGFIPITVSASNMNITLPVPANQTVVTEYILEYLDANSSLLETYTGNPETATVNGTYEINSRICWPEGKGINATTVQFLTHGVGFDKTYWDFQYNYSYVDIAAEAGYTTFLYDRLGTGLSAHPDPIKVVQAPTELEIAHALIQGLRTGDYSSTKFKHVVGVGHSYGSIETNAVTVSYPSDLDAAVLTGFSGNSTGQELFFAGLNSAIAYLSNPYTFAGLNNAYLVADSVIGNQFAFFRHPYFAANILIAGTNAKQTYTFGQLFTTTAVGGVAENFTGPVAVVNGLHDLPFCDGNCLYPTDITAAALEDSYPKAAKGSVAYNVPGSGHGINLHYEATSTFEYIQSFVKSNGL